MSRPPAFRDAVQVVVIDPSAPYASGIRTALPDARIAVDHWHLVRLANDMVTEVRQRVAREQHGRRGIKTDAAWPHRRMLLTAGDRLSKKQLVRLDRVLAADDPTDEIAAAWACKELLRQLLGDRNPDRIRHRLWRFCNACASVEIPEVTQLAITIETWWPHIAVFLELGVTNARTEGFNRIIKQTKRVACGFTKHGQLPAPYPRPHRRHPSATDNRMTKPLTPRKSEETAKRRLTRAVPNFDVEATD